MAEMTEIIGIVAEFNPFHLGHKRLLTAAAAAGSVKIVALSGNWMQRGEPALIDKWTRAEMALENGADIVVELPLLAAVQGADFFASGAVDILQQLGVTTLCFGSEETVDYQRLSEIYTLKKDEMAAYMAELPAYLSYPQKAEKTWTHFAGVNFDGGTPNHILGLAYAKAVAGTGLQIRTLQRETDYNGTALEGKIASATAIRRGLLTGQDISAFVPENTLTKLLEAPKVSWDAYFPLLKYKISLGKLTDIYQVNDELANRLSAAFKGCQSISELETAVYTKRYTRGHIRRLLVYSLLDIPREVQLPTGVHVLGFTQKGQAHLATLRKDVKLVTKIGQYPWDRLTQQADTIYQLGNPRISEQTYGRKPIM